MPPPPPPTRAAARAHGPMPAPRAPRPRASAARRVAGERHGARPRQVDLDDPRDPPRPRRHHHHPIGEGDGLGHAVGDEDHGARPLEPEALELGVERLAGQGVERAERLVEEEHGRVDDQRPRQRRALGHAAGQLPRPQPRDVGEADLLERLGRRALDARPARRPPAPSAARRCRAPIATARGAAAGTRGRPARRRRPAPRRRP